jgi:hypothetical protein
LFCYGYAVLGLTCGFAGEFLENICNLLILLGLLDCKKGTKQKQKQKQWQRQRRNTGILPFAQDDDLNT